MVRFSSFSLAWQPKLCACALACMQAPVRSRMICCSPLGTDQICKTNFYHVETFNVTETTASAQARATSPQIWGNVVFVPFCFYVSGFYSIWSSSVSLEFCADLLSIFIHATSILQAKFIPIGTPATTAAGQCRRTTSPFAATRMRKWGSSAVMRAYPASQNIRCFSYTASDVLDLAYIKLSYFCPQDAGNRTAEAYVCFFTFS